MGKYRACIRDNTGKGRCDLTLLYSDPVILREAVADMAAPFTDVGITKVMALDAQGFALGALVAQALSAGLVFVRKAGKIAWQTYSVEVVDYTRTAKTLEIAEGVLDSNDKVLVVDDWSETGGQLRGAIALAERCGAEVIGMAAINIDDAVLQDTRLSPYKLHYIEHYR
jgi:adenine phosphoribosyltransferase